MDCINADYDIPSHVKYEYLYEELEMLDRQTPKQNYIKETVERDSPDVLGLFVVEPLIIR